VRYARLAIKNSLRVCSSSYMWLVCGLIPTIGIRASSKIWSCACPREATRASASGRAIVGRRSDRVEMASIPLSARRQVIVARWSNMEGATGHCHRQGNGRGWLLMGEVVLRRSSVGEAIGWSLMKIIIRDSMCQGVMGVQVITSSRRRVCESSLCSSACFCKDPFQLKRVTSEGCLVQGVTKGEGRAWRQVCLDVEMLRIVGPWPVKLVWRENWWCVQSCTLHAKLWPCGLVVWIIR
jgi:hypothetical protein